MADIHWGDANLAVVDWGRIKILGNEYQANQRLDEGEPKKEWTRLGEYRE